MSLRVKTESHLVKELPSIRDPGAEKKTILELAKTSLDSASNLPQPSKRSISRGAVFQKRQSLGCTSKEDLIRMLSSSGISKIRVNEIANNIATVLSQDIQEVQKTLNVMRPGSFMSEKLTKVIEKQRSTFFPCLLTDIMKYLSVEEYSKLIASLNVDSKEPIFFKAMSEALSTSPGIVKELLKMEISQDDINYYFIRASRTDSQTIEFFYGSTTVDFEKKIKFPEVTYMRPRENFQNKNLVKALALVKVQLKQEKLEDTEIQSIVDNISENIEEFLNFCPTFKCSSECLVAAFGSISAIEKMYDKSGDFHSPPSSDKCIYPVGFAMKFGNFDTLGFLMDKYYIQNVPKNTDL